MQALLIKFIRLIVPHIIRLRYALIGSVVIGVFAMAVMRIDTALKTERNEEEYGTQLLQIKQVKFDQAAAERIRGLEKSDAEIQADLEANRKNPFQ